MGFLKRKGFLEGLLLVGMDGERVLLSDLWRDQVVILKVLHKPGCKLCRYEQERLQALKPDFAGLNVRLVGVGFEQMDLHEFVGGNYLDWELFIDPDSCVAEALGLDLSLPARVARRLGLGGSRSLKWVGSCGIYVITPNHVLECEYRTQAPSLIAPLKELLCCRR